MDGYGKLVKPHHRDSRISGLMDASNSGDLNEVERLFAVEEFRLHTEVKNRNGSTPLIAASANGCLNVVRFLIKIGADVNATNMYGDTPLISASKSGKLEVVKFLVEAGSDVNATNGYGKSAFHCTNSHAIMKFLESNTLDVKV